jgi:hypothetical protein
MLQRPVLASTLFLVDLFRRRYVVEALRAAFIEILSRFL